jgi:hypothetical protein
MNSIRGLDGAIRLAAQHHYPALAEKINQLKERKINRDNEEENLIPSTEDIKDYIREELEKHISTQALNVPPTLITGDSLSRMFEDDNSDSLIQPNELEANTPSEGICSICNQRCSFTC